MATFQAFLALVLFTTSTVAVTCYSHDGISAQDSIYSNTSYQHLFACNPTAPGGSTCCFEWETCEPNLLCKNNDGSYSRQYCTDSTWTTAACSQVCPQFRAAGVELVQCSTNTFCCGISDCCKTGVGVVRLDGNGVIVSGGSSTMSTTSTQASTHTSSTGLATASAAAAQAGDSNSISSSSPGISGGAVAGIVVGCIAIIALGIAAALFVLRRRRRRDGHVLGRRGKASELDGMTEHKYGGHYGQHSSTGLTAMAEPAEASSTYHWDERSRQPQEMDAWHRAVEMPGS